MRREELDRAKAHFRHALGRLGDLGNDIAAQASLAISEDIFAHVFPRERGTRLGAIGFDAVKHLVLCQVEKRPPKLDLDVYPYLPKANVGMTSAASYISLIQGHPA